MRIHGNRIYKDLEGHLRPIIFQSRFPNPVRSIGDTKCSAVAFLHQQVVICVTLIPTDPSSGMSMDAARLLDHRSESDLKVNRSNS